MLRAWHACCRLSVDCSVEVCTVELGPWFSIQTRNPVGSSGDDLVPNIGSYFLLYEIGEHVLNHGLYQIVHACKKYIITYI